MELDKFMIQLETHANQYVLMAMSMILEFKNVEHNVLFYKLIIMILVFVFVKLVIN